MNQKHVILIMADQLRFDFVGKQYTPHINALMEEGVTFTDAYCASPLCVPARGSFFTGRYPNETGSVINPWEKSEYVHGVVKKGIPHLFGLMDQTWDSWHVGKQHFLTEDPLKAPASQTHWDYGTTEYKTFLKDARKEHPGGMDFKGIAPEMANNRYTRARLYSIPTTDRYEDGLPYYIDQYFTEGALSAIRNRDRTKPFLLNAMMLAPHPPLHIPEPYYSMYTAGDVSLTDNVARWYALQSPLPLYHLPGALGSSYTRKEWGEIWRVYAGLVTLLDDCVGQMVATLKAEGMYDDCLIVFTSDHGEMLGSHRLWQKMCMYEESVKTPLCIKFPKDAGITPKVVSAPVSAIDVFPTLFDYLGLPIPAEVKGRSLLPDAKGQPGDMSRPIFIQFDGNGARGNFSRCVVQDHWKLNVDLFKDEIFMELYNTKDDPLETNSLAFDPAFRSRLLPMLSLLRRHMEDTGDLLSLPPDVYDQFVNGYGPYMRTQDGSKPIKE